MSVAEIAILMRFRLPLTGYAGRGAGLLPLRGKRTKTGFNRSTYLGTSLLFAWQTAYVEIRDGASNTMANGEMLAKHAWPFLSMSNARALAETQSGLAQQIGLVPATGQSGAADAAPLI